MAAEDCWLTSEMDAAIAVSRFLDDFAGSDRAQATHLVLKQLRRRTEPDRVLACELAWEIHAGGYWSQLRDDHDRPYESEEAYFRDVLGLASWRTAYKRLSIGRMLSQIAATERAVVRAAVAEVGLAKTSIIAAAIERSGQWSDWIQLARQPAGGHAPDACVRSAAGAAPRPGAVAAWRTVSALAIERDARHRSDGTCRAVLHTRATCRWHRPSHRNLPGWVPRVPGRLGSPRAEAR